MTPYKWCLIFLTSLFLGLDDKIENSFEGDFDKLDGISYFSDYFWFNVRGSNTEPMLRLNAEAVDQKTLDNLIAKISNIISL